MTVSRHHTVRTVFGILIAEVYVAYILSYALFLKVPPPDGIILSGLVASLIALYKAKKGKGEEDRRSDESILL